MICLEDHQICKRKSSENCRECKKIDSTVRSRKQQVLDEITSNLDDSERRKFSIFDCDICDILYVATILVELHITIASE
jgi:short-subunit dehydrogenase